LKINNLNSIVDKTDKSIIHKNKKNNDKNLTDRHYATVKKEKLNSYYISSQEKLFAMSWINKTIVFQNICRIRNSIYDGRCRTVTTLPKTLN